MKLLRNALKLIICIKKTRIVLEIGDTNNFDLDTHFITVFHKSILETRKKIPLIYNKGLFRDGLAWEQSGDCRIACFPY